MRGYALILWYLVAVIAAIVACFLLMGCRTQYVSVPEYHYVDRVRMDTFVQRDSIRVTDSVTVVLAGDTVRVERWRVQWRDRWREKAVHDTLIVRDSIRVPYPVERQATKWEMLKEHTGDRIMWVVILCALLYYIFRKRDR